MTVNSEQLESFMGNTLELGPVGQQIDSPGAKPGELNLVTGHVWPAELLAAAKRTAGLAPKAMRGHGVLSNSVTIYFRAEVDLAPLLADGVATARG